MMNIDPSPSLQEYKALYEAALEFNELAPWNWMHETDIFGEVSTMLSGYIQAQRDCMGYRGYYLVNFQSSEMRLCIFRIA
jgi:hypothetical protein